MLRWLPQFVLWLTARPWLYWLVFVVVGGVCGWWAHNHTLATGRAQGYAARVAEERAAALDQTREAMRATTRLIGLKQEMETHYEQQQMALKGALQRADAERSRLQHAITASRTATRPQSPASAECNAASQRDGELLGAMERAGGAMAAEAERLRLKATALQDEVRFYYSACAPAPDDQP